MSKAFDKVPHNKIQELLLNCQIPLYLINSVLNVIRHRSTRGRINNSYSKDTIVNEGVPQGSLLSPILFNLFITDLLKSGLINTIYAYADDIKLLGVNALLLQHDLDLIEIWCHRNRMELNVDKSAVIHFG